MCAVHASLPALGPPSHAPPRSSSSRTGRAFLYDLGASKASFLYSALRVLEGFTVKGKKGRVTTRRCRSFGLQIGSISNSGLGSCHLGLIVIELRLKS